MTWLLQQRRVSQWIGSQGPHRSPATTRAERAVLGEEIQHYRAAVLTYCLESARAVTPGADLEGDERLRYPAVALRYQLEMTHAGLPGSPRLSVLMQRRPQFDLVQRWQATARIAVEGERELAALRRSPLSLEQRGQVLADTADLVRGLVVLDLRYQYVAGWRLLEHQGRLLTAAVAVSSKPDSALDPSVDGLGWRTEPEVIEGPALPGLAGVLQAQHNTLVGLGRFPSARNLRLTLVAQAELAQHAARLGRSVGSPTVLRFEERAEIYRRLVSASRTLGGELGDGRFTALESANAARRLRSVIAEKDMEEGLGDLAHLSKRVDARISAAVEHGFREKLYFVAIKLPTPGPPGRGGIAQPAQKYIPVGSAGQSDLLALVRDQLRQPPQMTYQPTSTALPRSAFASAVSQSPPRRKVRSASGRAASR